MARKKKAERMTTDEFRQMEREVGEESAKQAMDRRERERAERDEARRRGYLANRPMSAIVEAMMCPPEAVSLPTDFAAAWATDRVMFLKLINRPLTAEETRAVAGAMATLLEHNRRLRLLATDLVERLEKACNAVNSVQLHTQEQVKAIHNVWIAGETYINVEED